MSAPFEIKGKRGVLNLYFKGDELAIDLTEYNKHPATGHTPSVEMFVTYQQIGELIGGLNGMRDQLEERKNKRAKAAADELMSAGVSPCDPAEVTAMDLRRNPDVMESVALFYLNEVTDARAPELPF